MDILTMKRMKMAGFDEILVDILDDCKESSKNHYVSDCPYCHKEQHFYINRATLLWDCKKCGEDGNINKLLYKLGKIDLLGGIPIDIGKKLTLLSEADDDYNEDENLTAETKKLPIFFKRLTKHKYLSHRGFTNLEFRKYTVGVSQVKLRNYVIIAIMESNEVKGYIARFTEKAPKGKKILRYRNSKNTEFNKLLLGYDEINFMTKTVVLVEGFFDKVRVDKMLKLDYQQEVKCCCIFGKKLSSMQIRKLLLKGVENIILVLDADATNDAKQIGCNLNKYFSSVLVGFLSDGDLDDCSEQQFLQVFNTLQQPENFSINYVKKYNLT